MSVTRTKATRWKLIAGAGAAAAAAAATGVALSGVASASTPAAAPAVQGAARTGAVHAAPAAAAAAQPNVVTVLVGQGRMGSVPWKVSLEYHRTLPHGFKVPTMPPGVPTPKYTGLLCERMYLNGVRIDHQGGPWADCDPVTGPKQPLGGEGLWGFSGKGTSGYRLFVGEPSPRVAYAVLTFTDGHRYRAPAVHVPGTDFSAFAIPISKGHYIRSVDTFAADGHRLSHETEWH